MPSLRWHKARRYREALVESARVTTATFPGKCPACGELIKPGHKIVRHVETQKYVHARCWKV